MLTKGMISCKIILAENLIKKTKQEYCICVNDATARMKLHSGPSTMSQSKHQMHVYLRYQSMIARTKAVTAVSSITVVDRSD